MSYNTGLQENNATLQSILEVAQTLPTHGINYSVEETPTGGTWINGKPIYAKTFIYNVPNNATTSFSVSSISIETGWIDASASFLSETNSFNWPVACISSSNTHTFSIGYQPYEKNIVIYTQCTNPCTAYVRLLYTKTTD